MKPNIIIEGCDRLGKDTLIEGLLNELGYFQLVHYQKPLELDYYERDKRSYQVASFTKMFSMLEGGGMLMNRAHLGEFVYAPRYRGYAGDYVFDLEKEKPAACKNTLLVLLYASDWTPITDDGLSFNFARKNEEQEDFKLAFYKSAIYQKLLLDVTKDGQFKSRRVILDEVISAWSTT